MLITCPFEVGERKYFRRYSQYNEMYARFHDRGNKEQIFIDINNVIQNNYNTNIYHIFMLGLKDICRDIIFNPIECYKSYVSYIKRGLIENIRLCIDIFYIKLNIHPDEWIFNTHG